MPIYEFSCDKCQQVFERFFPKADDSASLIHDVCGGTGHKVYSLAAVKMFESFTTTNILPDGEPVTIRSQKQLRELEANHHVKLADKDAPPPQTIF